MRYFYILPSLSACFIAHFSQAASQFNGTVVLVLVYKHRSWIILLAEEWYNRWEYDPFHGFTHQISKHSRAIWYHVEWWIGTLLNSGCFTFFLTRNAQRPSCRCSVVICFSFSYLRVKAQGRNCGACSLHPLQVIYIADVKKKYWALQLFTCIHEMSC